MSSILKKQLIVLGSILVLMAFLLSLDIKGLIKPKGERKVNEEAVVPASASFDAAIAEATKNLPANLRERFSGLEKEAKEGKSPELKAQAYLSLAQAWDSAGNELISGLYMIQAADHSGSVNARVIGAARLKEAGSLLKDSSLAAGVWDMAMDNYRQAYEADNKNLDAKIGLAVCYVEKSENPMQGISMLLEVAKEHPDNEAANMNLGLFSMRSGQFDKAVSRFTKVAEKSPGAEVYFYLGEAYRNLGDKDNAIKAYRKAKTFITDPNFRAGIDKYINELNK